MSKKEMISESVVGFCRFLRVKGFPVGIKETIDALVATEIVTITDRCAFQAALRSLLSSSREESELFDQLFHQYWDSSADRDQSQPAQKEIRLAAPEGKFDRIASAMPEGDSTEAATSGASATKRLKRMDFSKIPLSDLPMLEEIAFRLWKQMRIRLVRRWRLVGKLGPVDLRRTIRHSIGHGGNPVDLMRKGRKLRKTNLVMLLDVSGSMELYSAFLLRFVYALNKYFKRMDSFLFSTQLVPVTSALRKKHLAEVLNDLTDRVSEWSGGTRIGECLRDFNQRFAPKQLTRHSVVVILSDGWDTGSPDLLSGELGKIKRRTHRLIWLNPLLGLAGYQPLTRGMSAALPHADVFAPAHNLQSLMNLERHWS
ncbi:VWA domain-containing protein [bacterium]|nr:VWA domain-containing protein [bacterium]